ncbi:MAG: Holliday junction resolvase RuvX [Chloroflexi bacterium]|nr:MAG: Holliday junction resolvase RuvX [Chloroflexota bacterium]
MNAHTHTRNGRILALDLGEKRIGVAVSDPTQTIASSYGVLKRKSRREDFARIAHIVAEQKAVLLVVGLPITLSGVEGQKATWVRDYTAELSQHLDIPCVFWDESLTTVQAEQSLRMRGIRGKKARERVDAVAAAFILQSYLDAQANRRQSSAQIDDK